MCLLNTPRYMFYCGLIIVDYIYDTSNEGGVLYKQTCYIYDVNVMQTWLSINIHHWNCYVYIKCTTHFHGVTFTIKHVSVYNIHIQG